MLNEPKPTTLTAETVLATLRQQPNLFEQYNIKTLALFGSTARNQATEHSDLDFLVEFVGNPTFKGYMKLKFYLEELFHKPVDLVTQRSIKLIIRDQILSEAIYV
ncbi:nucleotidyltransferase family protein [Limnothrix sp. FACHB-881]|uniref:nucleotidyltransferase family protein n=1 Tax=unclassified Limnothrix TaxID=2632864 RepID=UPI00168060AC|nr:MULTISPECIES: nucleotidyltransferase family protein [unclassified Limnothrix]MBD2160020.1 nucleotidyltransferase family protein [Limnothrix sp. FACHB-1083]MBD2190720.1 nucleotidyltransferase family protein [Limnothrix sp. FACHB-1088]MBD2635499.1 nucleotidyltransferase family protein [Limnothrix sp. FACHB-881]